MHADDISHISTWAQLLYLKNKDPFPLFDNPVTKIYFLVNGTAKIVRPSITGSGLINDILIEGGIFGDLSLKGIGVKAYITGLKPNTCLFYFTTEVFKKLLVKFPMISMNYIQILGKKIHQLEERHFTWMTKDAKYRLLYFIRDWSRITGIKSDNLLVSENPFSHNDIAEYIGVSRQFIHTLFKELKDEGLVHYSRKKIEVAYPFINMDQDISKKAG
jgi:CRP/FNR family transcriptional regulator